MFFQPEESPSQTNYTNSINRHYRPVGAVGIYLNMLVAFRILWSQNARIRVITGYPENAWWVTHAILRRDRCG